ncbi:hypothetical protein [Actinomadura sp. NEAU-AAG7]|uniref:hypothetical protein n=1 Tax=Actinomadura sp. NEAU-AAG7 TaxID=2839640 RepID=UPI001BE4621E|nr:hypothetical protein [Actinomadura sp. NEAU-AAG7]MBT2213463.1 hypothetical protein [Actinomadura sp. NEAU-AAG7]
MALGDPYADMAALKARLGIALDDIGDDARLAGALAAASAGIESCTGRVFNSAVAVSARVYRPDAPRRVDLDDFSTAVGLVVEVDRTGTGTYETWAAEDYDLAPAGGVVSGAPGWPYDQLYAVGAWGFTCGRRVYRSGARPRVRVTARWGWAAVPAPIAEAALIVAAEIYKLRDAPFGVAGFGEWGPVRVRQNPIAMAMIAPYERYRVLVG